MKRNILKTLLLGCCISLNLPIQGIESKNYEKEFPLSHASAPKDWDAYSSGHHVPSAW